MIIFGYDIYDGDKGIIIANNEEEAREIFKKGYPDIPIVGIDVEDYVYDTCNIEEIATLDKEPKLYFMYN